MDDAFQKQLCFGVCKDMLTHAFPIQGAVAADEGRTKLVLDQWNCRPASSCGASGNGIRIYYTGTQISKQLGYGAFATAYAPGQA